MTRLAHRAAPNDINHRHERIRRLQAKRPSTIAVDVVHKPTEEARSAVAELLAELLETYRR